MTKAPPPLHNGSPDGLNHQNQQKHGIPEIPHNERQNNYNPQQQQQLHVPLSQTAAPSTYVNPQYLPGGGKSLSGISIRAYGLGIAMGACSLLSAQLAYWGYGIWRAPFFVAVLSLFHYLEFDCTARYNPPDASTSSFLLLSNGIAYSIAHLTAMAEVLLRFWLLNSSSPSASSSWWRLQVDPRLTVAVGLIMIVTGQSVRVASMRKAKRNFNHLVQFYKKDDHELVTDGVYAFSRHPSYFGFFWWALGTQVVLENVFCLVAYAAVLWKFFSHRIMHEERHLVHFFGKAYIDYRQRVPTRIPFIR